MKVMKKVKLIENLKAIVSIMANFGFIISLIMAYKVNEHYALGCLISLVLGGLLIGILSIPKIPMSYRHNYDVARMYNK